MFASHRTVSAPDKSWKKKAFIKSKLNMLKTDRSVKDEEDNSKEISNISLNLNEVEGMLFIEAKNNKCEPNTDSALSSNDSDNRELPSTGSNLHESSSKSTLPHYESLIEMFIVDEPPKFEVVTGEKLHFELENVNNGRLEPNNSNSPQSSRFEKVIPALIFGFVLASIFALIGYGFINHSIT